MIAPFYFDYFHGKILITNEFGRYLVLSKEEFDDFLNKRIDQDTELYRKLAENYFVFDSSIEKFLQDMKLRLRDGKSYVFSATSLHIFVVTNFCNAKCVYCQAQSNSANGYKMMTEDIAQKAVDFALQSPQRELSFEFQGGEPLSNFEIIRFIVEYSEQMKGNKLIHYSIVSNLTLLTDEMISFFKKYGISISTSLDGNKQLHNFNRPLAGKKDSFSLLTDAIERIRKAGLNCGAIQTTTRQSLDQCCEIVDEYLALDMNSLFLRPLTPLGIALKKWKEIGYAAEEFIRFYKKCLLYIIEKNQEGHFIREGHASIFLSKIVNGYGVNYMELRSPCGAGIGQVAYYYDGNIYTCDEARMLQEMGDASFRIGNVMKDSYDTVMNSKICRAVCKYSILESLPQCCDCVYLPYCGVCPVVNYALEKDVISRSYHNYRCKIYKGMLDTVFELILDEENKRIMERWI